MPDDELMAEAKNLGAPYELVKETKELGRLPVVNFAAGGVATPADAALMMQLGADGVFVGSGIFKSRRPGAGGARHRAGGDALQRPARSSRRCRAGWARRCPAWTSASMTDEQRLALRGW